MSTTYLGSWYISIVCQFYRITYCPLLLFLLEKKWVTSCSPFHDNFITNAWFCMMYTWCSFRFWPHQSNVKKIISQKHHLHYSSYGIWSHDIRERSSRISVSVPNIMKNYVCFTWRVMDCSRSEKNWLYCPKYHYTDGWTDFHRSLWI